MSHIEDCLLGKKLYGDNFSADEISTWFDDEREGYANLGAKMLNENDYGYNALNVYHGFSHLQRICGLLMCWVLEVAMEVSFHL